MSIYDTFFCQVRINFLQTSDLVSFFNFTQHNKNNFNRYESCVSVIWVLENGRVMN